MVKFLYPLEVIGHMVTVSRTCEMKDLTLYPNCNTIEILTLSVSLT